MGQSGFIARLLALSREQALKGCAEMRAAGLSEAAIRVIEDLGNCGPEQLDDEDLEALRRAGRGEVVGEIEAARKPRPKAQEGHAT